MIPIILHMRNGDTVVWNASDEEASSFLGVVRDSGYRGVLAIDAAPAGLRLANLAAVDWIEVEGVPGAASAP